MSYRREIPRDLFNEANLLKCVGKLVLLIHDEKAPKGLRFTYDEKPFNIQQDAGDGSIYVMNVRFYVGNAPLFVHNRLNGRDRFPLFLDDADAEYPDVFDEDGELTDEFRTFCENLSKQPFA